MTLTPPHAGRRPLTNGINQGTTRLAVLHRIGWQIGLQ
jgi:hypothetical protein